MRAYKFQPYYVLSFMHIYVTVINFVNFLTLMN